MSHLRLPDRWTKYLLSQPETGMGYQRVAVRLKNGRTFHRGLVYNAEQLQLEDATALDPDDIADITVER